MQDLSLRLETALRALTARSLAWVRSGWMSLEEARYLDDHSDLSDAQVDACMQRHHGAQHARFLAAAPGIEQGAADLEDLVIELWEMSPEIQAKFLEGTITLFVARFAAARRYEGESLRKFLARNAKSTRQDLERERVLHQMEKNPRVPRQLIADYRDSKIHPDHLRIVAQSLEPPVLAAS